MTVLRRVKSMFALVVLLALVVGVPWLLVRIAGWPLPSQPPDWDNALTMARQGNIPADFVIKSIAVLVWIAWAQLMWAVLWESIVNVPRLVSGRRWRPPPLVFAPVGDGVARLFSIVLAVGVLTTTTPGATPALAASSGVDVPLAPTSLDLNAHEARTAETLLAPQLAWTVTTDDDLWSIAEQALGDGARVDDIIALNPGISARSLRAGTVLQLPSDATVPQPAVAASVASPELAGDAAAGDTAVRYVVEENDGMWNVAEALLGDGSRHTELHELLAGQEVAPGVVFTADTYVIHPGWEFTLTPSSSNGTAPNQGPVEHVVERGESLWSIAEEELGEAERWPEIWEAEAGNVMEDGRTFDDPNLIQPGWRLDVPRGNAVDAPSPPLVDAPSPGSDPVAEETDPALEAGADSAGETGDVDTEGAVGEGHPSSSDRAVDVAESGPTNGVDATLPRPDGATPRAAPTGESTRPIPTEVAEVRLPGSEETESGLESVRDYRPVWLLGLSSTALATGLWGLARWYRRRAGVRGGSQLRENNEAAQLVDEALRTSSDTPLISWANVELASLVRKHGVNEHSSLPMVVKLGHTSGLIVQWEPPLSASSFGNWEVQADGVEWRLAPPSSPEQLTAQPVAIPGLVTIGHREDDDVLIDLESCGSMTVYGDMAAAEALVRSMVLELGSGGLVSNCQVHTVGLDIDGSERLSRVRARTEEEAITHLRAIRVQHDAVLQEAERSSMLELRSASSPEGREITVIAVRATACERLSELLEAAMPQRGIAVVVVGEAPCATSIVIENDQTAVVSPLGLVVGAAGVPRQTAAAIAVHMDRVSEALHVDVTTAPAAVEQSWGDPWSEPTHLVRVLGEPAIADTQDLGWREVEVLAFAACAGGSTTDDDLIDAVFSGRLDRGQVWDLVSGIRASAGTVLAPRNEGGNNIELAAGSLTDVQWMSRLAFRSHARDDEDAINDLVTAMQLVKGTPFAATAGFEWASTTGDMAAAYEMIERCGYLLVERAIVAGRIDEARTTLASVLAHLGPNEPLTQALMRLERAAGDTSAVESAYGDFSQRLAYLGDGAVVPAPGNGTTMLLTHATDTAEAAVSIEEVPEPTPKVERRTVRPKVLLRTFGEVCVEGSTSTQALAVAFAVAAADRAMSGEDLSELTGYSRKSLSTVFTSSNELLDRTEGRLTLRDGVWTDHQWMLECARRAEQADVDGDAYDAIEWLRTLFSELTRVDGKAFESQPGKATYWSWLDDFPVDVSARAAAEAQLVEAALLGVQVWRSAEATEQLPADVVVKSVCELAHVAPFAVVAAGVRPDEVHSSAECLLLVAHRAAAGRGELVNTVIGTAQKLVAAGTIEASDELADALGL